MLNLEWKTKRVTDGESEERESYEVMCAGWGEPGGEWTGWGWDGFWVR